MRETRGEVPAEGDFKSTPALVQGRIYALKENI